MKFEPLPIQLDEKYQIRVLICYLLSKTNYSFTMEQLVDLTTNYEMVNYFDLVEALNGIERTGLCTINDTPEGVKYSVTEKGCKLSNEFRKHVPKTIREKVVMAGIEMVNGIKREKAIKHKIIPLDEGGFHVEILFLNELGGSDLMDIKLYAPDNESANLIHDRILKNPAMFYHYVMNYSVELDELHEDSWDDI